MASTIDQIIRQATQQLAASSPSPRLDAEVLLMHVAEEVTTDGLPDNAKLDLVGRLGADWYCTTSPNSLFALPRPSGP